MKEIIGQKFDFYYSKEAEQFSFYRIPKLLFTDKRFSKLSIEAKVLYGLLLDRMSLSIKNGWYDEENRVYIYFKISDAMECMNICKEKAIKLFAELDSEKGCGLIFRIKQRLCKPDIIYVMNFNSGECPNDKNNNDDMCDLQRSEKQTSGGGCSTDLRESEKQTSEKSGIPTAGSMDYKLPEVDDTDPNKNNINNTDFSNINPIISTHQRDVIAEKVIDEIDERERYRKIVSKNIEFEIVAKNYSPSLADGILEIMLDAICSKKAYLIISGEEVPQTIVKSRLLKLNYNHIEYVLDCLMKNTTKIYNMKNYLLTSLYNSLTTMDNYYMAEVNKDIYCV